MRCLRVAGSMLEEWGSFVYVLAHASARSWDRINGGNCIIIIMLQGFTLFHIGSGPKREGHPGLESRRRDLQG